MSREDERSDTDAHFHRTILEELRNLRLDVDGLKSRDQPGRDTGRPSFDPRVNPPTSADNHPDTSANPAAIGTADRAPRSFELQNAFSEVRDKYSSRRLSSDLLFSTQRRNVKTDDAATHSVLAKVAKYCETGLKVVGSQDPDSVDISEVLNDCLIVFTALMRCIQDEGVQLVVNKNYDKDWANQYKSVMSGQTDVRAENINAMDRTATILKHRAPGNAVSHQPSGRGRGRLMRNRGPFRGKSHDVRARDREPTSSFQNEDL